MLRKGLGKLRAVFQCVHTLYPKQKTCTSCLNISRIQLHILTQPKESDASVEAASMNLGAGRGQVVVATATALARIPRAAGAAGAAAAGAAAAAPVEVRLCEMVVCRARSDATRWFEVIILPGGEQPSGTLCWACGMACEAFPLLTKPNVVEKVEKEVEFRQSFALVRRGVEATLTRSLPRQNVHTGASIGCRVVVRLAFVEVLVLVAKFGTSMEGLANVATVELIGPENTPMKGVLFKLDDKVEELPHFLVELYYDQTLAIQDTALHESEMLREGQATDLYAFVAKNQVDVRSPQMRMSKIPTALKLTEYAEQCTIRQRELQARELQASQQHAGTDAARMGAMPTGIVNLGAVKSASRLAAPVAAAAVPSATVRQMENQKKTGKSAAAKAAGAAAKAAAAFGTPPTKKRRSETGIAPLAPAAAASIVVGSDSARKRKSAEERDQIDIERILRGWSAGRELSAAFRSNALNLRMAPCCRCFLQYNAHWTGCCSLNMGASFV